MKTVVVIYRVFSNYRKPIFDELNKEYSLYVIEGNRYSSVKRASSNYSEKVKSNSYSTKETNVYLRCLRKLKDKSPDIVVHEFAVGIISLPVVATWCWINKKKFVLWSHGYDRKKGFCPKKSFLDKYRLWLMRKCDALIVYGDQDKKLLSSYINDKKIFVAKNTLDTKTLIAIRQILVKRGRENIKQSLNFTTKYNIIYIGRLIEEKKADLLVEMVDFFPENLLRQTTIHFIGDGPFKRILQEKSRNRNLLFDFHGAEYDEFKNGAMLFASDLMILPGAIGLSVNHALAFLCPVITLKRNENGPFHGPEEEYIIDGQTGFFIEEHSARAIALKTIEYLNDNELQQSMKKAISKYFDLELDSTNMVKGLSRCFEYLKETQ